MRIALIFLLCIASAKAFGSWTRFEIRDAAQRDVVQFVSDAPLEKIIGITHAITGWIGLDPDNLSRGVQGEVEVDVRTFDTGIPLHNEHFRTSYMEAARYPFAKFTLKELLSHSEPRLTANRPALVRVRGVLDIKGKQVSQMIEARWTYFKQTLSTEDRLHGNLLKVSSNFAVDLQTFGIFWSSSLSHRLARSVRVSVDALGTDASPPMAIPEPEEDELSPTVPKAKTPQRSSQKSKSTPKAKRTHKTKKKK